MRGARGGPARHLEGLGGATRGEQRARVHHQRRHLDHVLGIGQGSVGPARPCAAEVAQRLQPFRRLRVQRPRARSRRLVRGQTRQHAVERLRAGGARVAPRRLAREEVALLAGIGPQVVALRPRGEDEALAQAAQAEERRPSEVGVGHHRFHVDGAPGIGLGGDEAQAVARGRVLDAQQVHQGRGDVGQRDDGPVHHGGPREEPRAPQDQRHAGGGAVQEHRVGPLPVLAQALAVVPGHHDQGVVALPRLPQGVEQAPELAVHEGDLAVVGGAREASGEGLGRGVRGVGVEVVDPGQERPAPVTRAEPRHRGVGGACRVALVVSGGPRGLP